MKLVIAEYLRTMRERDELDRLIPTLVIAMGYDPIHSAQSSIRQYGVDFAARGTNTDTNTPELLLFVIKQKDIGRHEWNSGLQSVRQSIEEILDSYLHACVEPDDQSRTVRIIVATNGERKQEIQIEWTGFVKSNNHRASIEFWGVDRLAADVETHLLNEQAFRDEDRSDLRRALALCSDSEYDQCDLHQLLLRTLGLTEGGQLTSPYKTGRSLEKAYQIANFATQMFCSWAINNGDSRQAINACERLILWAWHRLHLAPEDSRNSLLTNGYVPIFRSYDVIAKAYFQRISSHCVVEDGLSGYYSSAAEASIVAFEHLGMLATIGLSEVLWSAPEEQNYPQHQDNAKSIAELVASMIENNKILHSPCYDRHCAEITLALCLFILTGKDDIARQWIEDLVLHIDFAFQRHRNVPLSSDLLDDLVDEGGWATGGKTADHLMDKSWMLATLAGWTALLGLQDEYDALSKHSRELYPEVCLQLWHPDEQSHSIQYFSAAHRTTGNTEAPIRLLTALPDYLANIDAILTSTHHKKVFDSAPSRVYGLMVLDVIAWRHFSTPVSPFFWYHVGDSYRQLVKAASLGSRSHS
jgi:hypothetical protein